MTIKYISLQHLLPLPFFLTLAPNIFEHWNFALASEPLRLPVIGLYLPKLFVYLIGNVLTQYPFLITVVFSYLHHSTFNKYIVQLLLFRNIFLNYNF